MEDSCEKCRVGLAKFKNVRSPRQVIRGIPGGHGRYNARNIYDWLCILGCLIFMYVQNYW